MTPIGPLIARVSKLDSIDAAYDEATKRHDGSVPVSALMCRILISVALARLRDRLQARAEG